MKTSYTILYVDDDLDDLMLITDAFQKYTPNIEITHAHNGLEGLATLERMHKNGEEPCLVIVDINMPGMDGKEMLQEMRRQVQFQHLPVVLFSTSNLKEDQLHAQGLGADFITKPVSFSNLQSLVKAFIGKCKFEVAGRA